MVYTLRSNLLGATDIFQTESTLQTSMLGIRATTADKIRRNALGGWNVMHWPISFVPRESSPTSSAHKLTGPFAFFFPPNWHTGGVRAFSGSTAAMSTGKVTQVIGAVVDVQVSYCWQSFLFVGRLNNPHTLPPMKHNDHVAIDVKTNDDMYILTLSISQCK